LKRFAIFGASGCGRGILPLVRQQLQADLVSATADLVFVDDQPNASVVNGPRVLTYAQWLKEPASSRHMNVAIANSQVRQKLVQRCATDGAQLDDVLFGEGAVLCPFVTLTSNVRIGQHFQANLYSYVEHDCVIGDFVTFAPAVRCNGNVHIENHAYIGTGAVIKQGLLGAQLVIGHGAIVGMGAVVTKCVPGGVTVVGNPARLLIKN
jgi:sugar O-acyltransferase (sialic acid O-acetyltransferase NeuD family)